MKNILPVLCAGCILLCFACNPNTSSYTQKLEKQLTGLTKMALTFQEKEVLLTMIRDSSNLNFPVFSIQGELLNQAYVQQHEMNFTVDCFSDSTASIKAVVFRGITKPELSEISKSFEDQLKIEKQGVSGLKNVIAPFFATKDIHDAVIDMNALKGKVVVMNFWFIKCAGCVQEIPELNEILYEFNDKEVVFLGLTFDSALKTKAFLQHHKFEYNIIADAQYIFDLYGIKPCPANIVIDKTGRIAYVGIGYKPRENQSKNELTNAIKIALGQ